MKILDFSRNAYQFNVFLKFPSISGERATETLQALVGERKVFRFVLKGETATPLVLSVGEGTETAPLLQLKIGTDTLSLFSGWFVPYDNWVRWRDSLIPVLAQLLRGIPNELVLGLFSQCSSPIPADRVKRIAEIPELKPLMDFFQPIIPLEYRERGNSYVSFSDVQNKQTVEWWLGGWGASPAIPGYENVLFSTRLNILEGGTDLRKAMETHAAWSDSLLERFHTRYLSLLIK